MPLPPPPIYKCIALVLLYYVWLSASVNVCVRVGKTRQCHGNTRSHIARVMSLAWQRIAITLPRSCPRAPCNDKAMATGCHMSAMSWCARIEICREAGHHATRRMLSHCRANALTYYSGNRMSSRCHAIAMPLSCVGVRCRALAMCMR